MISFTCPRCGTSSQHPLDALEGYCGRCHDWTDPEHKPMHFNIEGKPIPPSRFHELRSTRVDYYRVAEDMIGDVRVSTVWLGMNHSFGGPPLIFETMTFERGEPVGCWRYSTKEEALAGHEAVCAEIRVFEDWR